MRRHRLQLEAFLPPENLRVEEYALNLERPQFEFSCAAHLFSLSTKMLSRIRVRSCHYMTWILPVAVVS